MEVRQGNDLSVIHPGSHGFEDSLQRFSSEMTSDCSKHPVNLFEFTA
jgi:hypothetical protein